MKFLQIQRALQIALLASFALVSACGDHDHDDDHAHNADGSHIDHDDEGSHGGHIIELGSLAHVEYFHDHHEGVVKLYITGPDCKTALPLAATPVLKLKTADGQLSVETLAVGGALPSAEFTVSHLALKAEHPEGRLSIKVGDQTFNKDLEDSHGHDDDGNH